MPPSLFDNPFFTRSFQKKQKNPRIAVFRALFLGDLLCFLPAVRSIKESLPSAHICLIGLPWAQEFAKRYSKYFDDFIPFPGFPGLPEQRYHKKRFNTFLSVVSKKQFDIFLQMHGNGKISNKLFRVLSIPYSAGYTSETINRDALTSNRKHLFLYPENRSERDVWLSFVRKLGIRVKNSHLEFPIFEADKSEFGKLQRIYSLQKNKYVCIHAGAKDEKRRWSPKKFASIGDLFYKDGFQIVLTGTDSEVDLINTVSSLLHYPSVSLAGKTSLGGLAMLLNNSYAVITNDTGVSHLAEAIAAKHIVIYTVSESFRWLHAATRNSLSINSKNITSSYQILKMAQQIQ